MRESECDCLHACMHECMMVHLKHPRVPLLLVLLLCQWYYKSSSKSSVINMLIL